MYAAPPKSPEECLFSQLTTSVSADLQTAITPCQFGGVPDCENCGCFASAGLAAIARHRLLGVIPVRAIFNGSAWIGDRVRGWRGAGRSRSVASNCASSAAHTR